MTIVGDQIYTEILRYAYALSTSGWPNALTHTTVAGLVASLVIGVWHLRAGRRKEGGARPQPPPGSPAPISR